MVVLPTTVSSVEGLLRVTLGYCAFCCCTTVEYERKVRKGQESKVLPHCSWTAPHGWLIRCNVPPCIELFPLVMALPSAVDTRVLIVGW